MCQCQFYVKTFQISAQLLMIFALDFSLLYPKITAYVLRLENKYIEYCVESFVLLMLTSGLFLMCAACFKNSKLQKALISL